MPTLHDYRNDLCRILGVRRRDALPEVFGGHGVRVLKIGVLGDLAARYPSADRARLRDWLDRYQSEPRYVKRVAYGTHRHDLDGRDATLIEQSVKDAAHQRLRNFREAVKEQGAIMGAVG